MKRHKHTLSHYRMLTCAMGQIIPINVQEVLPGDTIQAHTDALIRCAPLNSPVMHPTNVRIDHFYVPNRQLWDGWEDFITGESTDPIPTVNTTADRADIRHYLYGVEEAGIPVNAMPLYAYNKIVNHYYRDQDLEAEWLQDNTAIKNCAWEKDYFTSARPWAQKGGDVTIPLGDSAPIKGIGTNSGVFGAPNISVTETDGSTPTYGNSTQTSSSPSGIYIEGDAATGGKPQIFADLANATGADINDVRRAFALQRYQEARARYGSRYTEYLRYLGVRPSDARLQNPEHLGRGVTRLNFTEVLQTGPTLSTPNEVGTMYGHGIAGFSGNKIRRFFEEHGYFITLMSVRPKAVYMDGINRSFLRKTKEDFWQKELEHIGQQEVLQDELNAVATNDRAQIFGYQDRYREYRESPSMVLGDFRQELDFWNMARKLPDAVTLNGDFIKCDPDRRIFQVDDSQHLWCAINNHVVARRFVAKNAKARVL